MDQFWAQKACLLFLGIRSKDFFEFLQNDRTLLVNKGENSEYYGKTLFGHQMRDIFIPYWAENFSYILFSEYTLEIFLKILHVVGEYN